MKYKHIWDRQSAGKNTTLSDFAPFIATSRAEFTKVDLVMAAA